MANKAIKCGKMFDSTTGAVRENMVIFTDGERIASVVPAAEANCDGYEVIDLGDKFVTPGLIDSHVHLSMNGEANPAMTKPYETIADWTLKALQDAHIDLMAGFTALRVVGGNGFADEAVRDAINRGEHWGPRLMTSGCAISTTGGHADDHYGPYLNDEMNTAPAIGDGPDELVKAVRYNIKHGCDMIKYMSTGGVMSLGTTIDSQQMSFEEMKAICDTAKLYNMTIATHAHGTSGINDAIRAGVTSVEHGMLMNEEGIELMKEHGTTLVPTLIAAERIIVKGKEIGTPDWAIAKAEYVFGNATRNFKRCLDEGVKIAFGTDSGTPYNFHGKQTYEFELMVKYGMTPTQALMAATKGSSELMRKDHEIGSIEPGKFADVVAFDGDPIADVKALTSCSFVMKGGEVYKKDGVALRK